jgi:hypothetical protein
MRQGRQKNYCPDKKDDNKLLINSTWYFYNRQDKNTSYPVCLKGNKILVEQQFLLEKISNEGRHIVANYLTGICQKPGIVFGFFQCKKMLYV